MTRLANHGTRRSQTFWPMIIADTTANGFQKEEKILRTAETIDKMSAMINVRSVRKPVAERRPVWLTRCESRPLSRAAAPSRADETEGLHPARPAAPRSGKDEVRPQAASGASS